MLEQPVLSVSPWPFGALSEFELRALRQWISAARDAGIDHVEDLKGRPWPAEFSGAVLGVFTPGEAHATWLAVGQNGSWAIASLADGTVSEPVDSLPDALALIYRVGEAGGCD